MSENVTNMNTDEKECPYCAEVIKLKAIKCRHCRAELNTTVDPFVDVSNINTAKKDQVKDTQPFRCPKCFVEVMQGQKKCVCGLIFNNENNSNKHKITEQSSNNYFPNETKTPNLKTSGGIICIIGGIFGIISAVVTFGIGGLVSGLSTFTPDPTDYNQYINAIWGLGWTGIVCSFLSIILGVIALVSSSNLVGYSLLVTSIFGLIISSSFVSLFMVLSFVGSILVIRGTSSFNGVALLLLLLTFILSSTVYYKYHYVDAVKFENVERVSISEIKKNRIFAIGETVTTNKYEFNIIDVTTTESLGSEFFKSYASKDGIYVVVSYTMKNVSQSPLNPLDLPEPQLIDFGGNRYNPDVSASHDYALNVDLDEKIFSDLSPGITRKSAKVFEVNRDRFNSEWKIKFGQNFVSLNANVDKKSIKDYDLKKRQDELELEKDLVKNKKELENEDKDSLKKQSEMLTKKFKEDELNLIKKKNEERIVEQNQNEASKQLEIYYKNINELLSSKLVLPNHLIKTVENGKVAIEISISSDGYITKSIIIESSGSDLLDTFLLDKVKKQSFVGTPPGNKPLVIKFNYKIE